MIRYSLYTLYIKQCFLKKFGENYIIIIIIHILIKTTFFY